MKRILLLISIFLVASIFLVNSRKEVHQSDAWEAELAWNEQWENKEPIAKTDRPDLFAKLHWMIRTRAGSSGPEYAANYKFQELEKAKNSKFKSAQARTQALDFVERGPGNVPGRTRGLAVFPDDPTQNTWIAGGVGGGMWFTTDAGVSWENLTTDLPNLAISTIAISESNTSIIYAGTGESFAGLSGARGDGVFKSVNGGTTWTQLAATASNEDFQNVNRLIVDPNNPNIVLACTSNDPNFSNFNSGIFKSTNGGTTWTRVFSGSRWVQQLIPSPDNFNVLYASVSNAGVFKSINAGDTWSPSSIGMIPNGRVELAIAPTDPNRIYASVEGTLSGTESDLYISEDAGATWAVMIEPSGATNEDFLGGQGGYDNTIAVHPYNKDIVYVGGVNIFQFNLEDGTSTGAPTVLGVTLEDTDFLDFVSFDSGSFFENKLAVGTLPGSEFVAIEWRFGPGLSQKAHRFQVPAAGGTNGDGGAGVPDNEYSYQDYVDVPFEVWDTDNNRQLMISFRDQQRDGAYNLNPRDDSGDPELLTTREYFYIHGIEYDPDNPDASIAVAGGHTASQMYFMWPILADGADPWDPNNLPESKLVINYGSVINRFRSTVNVSDAFNQLSGNNRFLQTFGSSNTSSLGLHPDHHNMQMQKINDIAQTFRILISNDGGVYYSNTSNDPGVNDGDWVFAGNGYNTSQFYGADKKAGAFEFVGGMQDNGTYRSPDAQTASASTLYRRQIGGDGFKVAWHYTDPAKIIGGSQFNGFRRTTDGGANWANSTVGLSDIGEDDAPFVSWLANSKKNPNVLFAVGSSGVWRSPDFGGVWESVPITTNWGFNGLSQVAISQANPAHVWAGSGMTATSRLHFSTDGGNSFTAVNNFPGEPLGTISSLATHPGEENTAYAIFSFSDAPKILRTVDAGQTWEDISGFGTNSESDNGFPDVPVFSLLVLPNDPNTIWAGTEIGIVESVDNGATWAIIDEFINASVWELKAVDDQVVIATHGRGIWSVTIDGLIWPNEIVTALPDTPQNNLLSLNNQPNPVREATNFNYSLPRSSKVQFEVISSDGRLLARYDLGVQNQGPGKFLWNRDQLNFGSGVYFVRMNTDLGTRTSKMILQ